MAIIETASVTLRPWTTNDAVTLVANANERQVWENLRDRFPHPYRDTDAEAWIASRTSQSGPALNLAISLDGEAIGAIGLEVFSDIHRGTAEIGYWLGIRHWGRGYATDAVVAMTTYAFDQLGLERVQASVFEWNPASERVLRKAGYQFEGRLRRHVTKAGRVGDLLLYATVRSDRRASSAERDR